MEERFKTYRIIDGLSYKVRVLKKDFLSLCNGNAAKRLVGFMRGLAIGSRVVLQRKLKPPGAKRAKWIEICQGRVTLRHELFVLRTIPSMN